MRFAGNVARGMTVVVLSNGGGVGIGRSINGGNGIVLDGSDRMDEIVRKALSWDVMESVPEHGQEMVELLKHVKFGIMLMLIPVLSQFQSL